MTLSCQPRSLFHLATVTNRLVFAMTVFTIAGGVGLLAFGWLDVPVSAWVAIALFAGFYGTLFRLAPASAIMMIPAFAGLAFTQFISGIMIESGGYFIETREYGSPTGAFLRLAIIYVMFFGTAAVVIERYLDKWRARGQIAALLAKAVHPSKVLAAVFSVIVIVGLFFLVYIGLKNGFPLLRGEDRFAFLMRVDNPVYVSLMGNRTGAIAFVGMMLALGSAQWFYRTLAFSIVIVSALLGDKFTEYIVIFGLLAGPSFCVYAWRHQGLPLRKLMLLGLAITVVTMPLVFVVYGGLSHPSAGLARMEERMISQGQLWFLADKDVNEALKFESAPLSAEAAMMLNPSPTPADARSRPSPYQGMAWLMLRFAPPSEAFLRLNSGIVFCLGLHAYFLEMFGWAGLIVLNFVFGAVMGLVVAGLLYAFIFGRLVYLLFFAKFFTFFGAMVSVADPFLFFNWKTALFFMVLVTYWLADTRLRERYSSPQTRTLS